MAAALEKLRATPTPGRANHGVEASPCPGLETFSLKEVQEIELRRQRTSRNFLFAIAVLLAVSGAGLIVTHRRQRRAHLALGRAHEDLLVKKERLEKAMAQVKLLSGLLPICVHCKNIRDDGGYWQKVERYIGDRSEAEFSHGLCPACAEKHYPDMNLEDVEMRR